MKLLRNLILLFFLLIEWVHLQTYSFEEDSPDPISSIGNKENKVNCGEDELMCMNMCPSVTQMILSSTFISDNRNYNYNDEYNNIFLLISNKRFNHGYDRYELKIYERSFFNLLFIKNISKDYNLIGYSSVASSFLFFHKEQVSSEVVLSRYIDMYETKIVKNEQCQEEANSQDQNEEPTCIKEDLYEVMTIYEYNYKNDEMKQIKSIPPQFHAKSFHQSLNCEISLIEQLLYCYNSDSVIESSVFKYTQSSKINDQVDLLQQEKIYSFYRYQIKNSDSSTLALKGFLVEKESDKIICSELGIEYLGPFVSNQNCNKQRNVFFFDKGFYVCQTSTQLMKISIKTNEIMDSYTTDLLIYNLKAHYSSSIKFFIARLKDADSVIDITTFQMYTFRSNEMILICVQDLVFIQYQCPENQYWVCVYQMRIKDLRNDKRENQQHIFSVKTPLNDQSEYQQPLIKFQVAEADEKDDNIIAFAYFVQYDNVKQYRIKVIDLSTKIINSMIINVDCGLPKSFTLKWVKYKSVLFLQDDCYSMIININFSQFYILLSKLSTSIQPVVKFNENSHSIFVHSKMDTFRSKFQIINSDSRTSTLIKQMNYFSIESMHVSMANSKDIILFSQSSWQHQYAKSSQMIEYAPSGFSDTFNVFEGIAYTYSSSKKFNNTIVVHQFLNTSEEYIHFYTMQQQNSTQFICIFYFLRQKSEINFNVDHFRDTLLQNRNLQQKKSEEKELDELNTSDSSNKDVNNQDSHQNIYKNNSQRLLENDNGQESNKDNKIVEYGDIEESEQFIIYSEERASKPVDPKSASGSGHFDFDPKAAFQPYNIDIGTYFDSFYLGISIEHLECINQIPNEQEYFYDELNQVLIFYYYSLCIIDVNSSTVYVKKELNINRKVFYHNSTNSIVIINLNSKSNQLYERIYLPNRIQYYRQQNVKNYEIINAYISHDVLIIQLISSSVKYIFIENLNSPTEKFNIQAEPYFKNPCSVYAGSYRHEFVQNRMILSNIFSITVSQSNQLPQKTVYRLVQLYTHSIDIFSINPQTLKIHALFCYKYEQTDYFHDLIYIDLVQVKSNMIHILFIFTYKIELQEFFYDIYESTYVQMSARINISVEITEILNIQFSQQNLKYSIFARSQQNLFIYDIPVDKETTKGHDPLEMQILKLNNPNGSYGNKTTCKMDSLNITTINQPNTDQFKIFYSLINFVQSIMYPPQFTLPLKIRKTSHDQPYHDLSLPSFGEEQKASIIIQRENFISTNVDEKDNTDYIYFESSFFENIMPLQKLKMDNMEILKTNSLQNIQIKKVGIISLSNIVFCKTSNNLKDVNMKFRDIDELIITNLTINNCEIDILHDLFSFENINLLKLQNITITNNRIQSSIGFKDLNIFNAYNVTDIYISNLNFTNNLMIKNQKESVEQLQNRSTGYQKLFTKFQNRLFNMRQIKNLSISHLNFNDNKGASLLGISSYTHHEFLNSYTRIREIKYSISLTNSTILNNILPQYYFFYVKNGETFITNLRVEGNAIQIIDEEPETYEFKEKFSNEENMQRMSRGKYLFCFLGCQQLHKVNLTIQNNELFQNMNLMVVSSIFLHSITNSTIKDNKYQISILLVQNSMTFLSDFIIENNQGTNRAIISFEKGAQLDLNNANIKNNSCTIFCKGSAVFVSSSNAKIKNSVFENNTSDKGGSIAMEYGQEVSYIESVIFNENSANYGGSLYIYYTKNIIIGNTTFMKNKASIGGAIYYEGYYPSGFFEASQLLILIDNTASLFGQNVGSYPQSLRLANVTEVIINGKFQKEVRNLGFTTKIDTNQQIMINKQNGTIGLNKSIFDRQNFVYHKLIYIDNVTSGATLVFYFEIYDDEGNRFTKYDPSFNKMRNIIPQVSTQSKKIVIVNTKISFDSEKKQLQLELEVIGDNSAQSNWDGSESIKVEYENIFITENQMNREVVQFKQEIFLRFRPCTLGEVYVIYQSQLNNTQPLQSLYKCEVCKLGKFSVEPQPTYLTQCQSCINTAVKQCYGSVIELNQGYWRSSMVSDNFLKCDLKENCNGGKQTDTKDMCHQGHIGPLCDACDIQGTVWQQRYAQTGNHSCTPCNTVTKNSLKILFFIFTTFIFIILVLKSTLKYCQNKIFLKYLSISGMLIMGCSANKKVTSVYVKILMSYVQGLNYVASPLEQVSFSGECFMADIGVNMPLVYFKILFALITPFVLLFIVLLFYNILFILKIIKNEKIKNYYSWTSIFYIILLFQNKIVNMLVEVFNRREIDGEVYMKVNLQYRFYDEEHENYFKYMIFPSLIFWTIGVILSILIILLKNRKNLQKVKSLFTFGFLYGEYREDCFYWELLRIFTRIGIAMACNFYHQMPKISCMFMFIIISLYLIILYWKKPFIQRQHNNIEIFSTFVCTITVSLSVVIYSQQQYQETQLLDNATTLQIVSQIIILIINIIFLIYISIKIFLSLIIRWEVSIYKIFGFCLGKKKTNDLLVLKRWQRLRHKVMNNFIQNRLQSKKYYKKNDIYSFDYQNDLQRFVHFCNYDINHLHNFYHINNFSLSNILNQLKDENNNNQDNNQFQNQLNPPELLSHRNSMSQQLDQLVWSDFLINTSQKNLTPLFLKKSNSSFQSLDDESDINQYFPDLNGQSGNNLFLQTKLQNLNSTEYTPPIFPNFNNQHQTIKMPKNNFEDSLGKDNLNSSSFDDLDEISTKSQTVFIELQKEDKQHKS